MAIEFTQQSMRVLAGAHGLSIPLERGLSGRLAQGCRERVVASLRAFIEKCGRASQHTLCAVDGRGVSIRVLEMPNVSGDEFERLLILQIEREFPLSPAQMAWGFQKLRPVAPRNGASVSQQVVVAAIRKELLQEYRDILSACGVQATFTLAALARAALVPGSANPHAVLNVAESHWELITISDGAPKVLRTIHPVLPSRAPESALEPAASSGGVAAAPVVTAPHLAAVEALRLSLNGELTAGTLYITGESPHLQQALAAIKSDLRGATCETIEVPPGEGRSAATLGLAKLIEEGGSTIFIESDRRSTAPAPVARPTWRWAVAAIILFILCVLARYAEVFIHTPRLTRQLADLKTYRDGLPSVERDLAFLQFLQTNQPKYFEVVGVLSEAAPSGTRVESLSLKRSGDFSMRAAFRDGQQVADFRSRLIKSEAFSTVVVEEQTPIQNNQKVNVRIGGDWKPNAEPKTTGDSTNRSRPAVPTKAPSQPTAAPN